MKAGLVTFWILLLLLLSYRAFGIFVYLTEQPASGDLPEFRTIAPLVTCLGAWYITPGVIALIREHHQALAIWVLNIFLGWSMLGWVGALVWACTAVRHPGKVRR